jgi:hypothetical protein
LLCSFFPCFIPLLPFLSFISVSSDTSTPPPPSQTPLVL